MAYTRVWDNTAPPGSAPANTLDTIIQQFREDTQQRISSLLKPATDINTDPLQLKLTAIGGGLTARKLTLQPFVNHMRVGTTCLARVTSVPLLASAIFMPFRVPSGCTITQFQVQANVTLGSAVDCIFELRTQIGGVVAVVSTLSTAVGGLQTLTSGVLAVAVPITTLLFAGVYRSPAFGPPDVDIYQVSVTIDTPSLESSF